MTQAFTRVVAIIPAKDSATSIGETIAALTAHEIIDHVLVVDDGSSDATTDVARAAGAQVVRLDENVGKGGAMRAGIAAETDADVFLFVDADTLETADAAVALLDPVLSGEADLTIGVLPSAGKRGGFGSIKRLATAGIERACGLDTKAPLSGQRAIRADLIRNLELAERFGVEVAMTIDAVRSGAVVQEIEVTMEHRHRGRSLDGFRHRGRQGVDVVRALWPRLVSRGKRLAIWALIALLTVAVLLVPSHGTDGSELPKAANVDVVLVPGWLWNGDGGVLQGVAAGSVVTGDVTDVVNAVASGSRDPDAPAIEGIEVRVIPQQQLSTFDPITSPADTITITVGITTTEQAAALRPILVSGRGLNGTLQSSSTNTHGLIDITDIAPTVLAIRGQSIPEEAPGSPLEVSARAYSSTVGEHRDANAKMFADLAPKVIISFVAVQVALYGWAWFRRTQGKSLRPVTHWALGVAGVPAATYLATFLTLPREVGPLAWSTICLAILSIIVGMSVIGTVVASSSADRSASTALRRIAAFTVTLLAVDAFLGTPMQTNGIFGSSQLLGTRYFGFGNPTTTVLLLSTVTWAALTLRADRRRLPRVVWTFGSIALLVGLPNLGADAGGLVAGLLAFGLTIVLFGRLRPTKLQIFAGAFAGVALAVAVFVYDAISSSSTHIGRTVSDGGISAAIIDRAEANFLGYGFPWSLAVIALAAAVLVGIARGRWSSSLPPGSLERNAVVALMSTAFFVYLLNDSGVVVLAISAVFVGPFIIVVQRSAARSKSASPEVIAT